MVRKFNNLFAADAMNLIIVEMHARVQWLLLWHLPLEFLVELGEDLQLKYKSHVFIDVV